MSFKKYDLSFPECPSCRVIGFLYSSDDTAELGQDMVEVRLPIGVTINAGWYPEGAALGSYLIKVWGAVNLPPVKADDADEAIQLIKYFVAKLTGQRPEPLSEAGANESEVYRDRWDCYELA